MHFTYAYLIIDEIDHNYLFFKKYNRSLYRFIKLCFNKKKIIILLYYIIFVLLYYC